MQLRIPLTDLYAAPGFLDPSGDAAPVLDAARVATLYSFLPADTSFTLADDALAITRPDPEKKRLDEAAELFERASKRAREGDHDKAIEQYERGLGIDPLQTTARRNLAMARMARGDTAGTDAELRRLLLLAPADAWAWVILGNLNFRQNFALAERYFRRAVELSPQDAYAWNSMGAMYTEKRDFPKAVTAFEAALKENPRFANAHFPLAMALAESGEPRRAFEALERMFASSIVPDTHTMPTFERAGRFYRELAQRLASETIETAEAEVESLVREAERVSGFPVQFEEGVVGTQTTALTEMAWKHQRDHHVVRTWQSLDPAVQLHLRSRPSTSRMVRLGERHRRASTRSRPRRRKQSGTPGGQVAGSSVLLSGNSETPRRHGSGGDQAGGRRSRGHRSGWAELRQSGQELPRAGVRAGIALGAGGQPNVKVEYDRLELLNFLRANFRPMNAMCERGGMFENLIYARTKAVFEYFGLPFDAPPP